jgi:hypothetical protein
LFSKGDYMDDTLWITLPVNTWRILFERAIKADRKASDFLRVLIESGEIAPIKSESTIYNPAPEPSTKISSDKKG